MEDYNLKRLIKFLAPYKKTVIAAFFALVFTASVTLLIGQGIRLLVDQGFIGSSVEFLNKTILIFLCLVLLLALGTFCRYYLVSWLGERVSSDLRIAVYNNLIKLHPGFFEENSGSEIQSRITADTVVVQTVIGSSISIALRNTIMCIGGIIWLFITNAKLTSIVLGFIPIVLIPILFFGRRVKKLSKNTQDSLAEVGVYVSEAFRNIKLVHSYNYEEKSRDFFAKKVEENFNISIFRVKQRAFLIVMVITLILGAIASMLWVGGMDVLNGTISPGELTAFIFYAVVVAGSIGSISEVWSDVQRANGAVFRLLELMNAKNEITTSEDFVNLKKPVKGTIEFFNVNFSYPTRKNELVLKDVSIKIESGQHVALIGSSGAGKSTIFDLILRLYDPNSGAIYFDGIDLKNLDLKELREQIAIVPQRLSLFSGTIAENIAYGKESATMEEIIYAAKLANIHDFIISLSLGYNTQIGELGTSLSGGQNQRIAIARAIVKKPKLLLLDEATSALDVENSHYVQEKLKTYFDNMTVIVITHRLSTVESSDKIILFDNGRIVAEGSHDQLLSKSSLYAKLLRFKTK